MDDTAVNDSVAEEQPDVAGAPDGFPAVLNAITRLNGSRRKLSRRPPLDPSTLDPDDAYFGERIPIPNGRLCVYCGKELLRLQKRYCDGTCARRWKYEQARKTAGKPIRPQRQLKRSPDGLCVSCREPLTGRQTRFCSSRCSNRESERSRRAERKKSSSMTNEEPALPDNEPVAHGDDAGVPEVHGLPGVEDVESVAVKAELPGWLTTALNTADEVQITLDGWRLSARRQNTWH
jgi:hypothetical protein